LKLLFDDEPVPQEAQRQSNLTQQAPTNHEKRHTLPPSYNNAQADCYVLRNDFK
jgi:hypothetical protein